MEQIENYLNKMKDPGSSFLRDVTAGPSFRSAFNVVYNMEAKYTDGSILVEDLELSRERALSTQLLEDLTQELLPYGCIAVKDTFPLSVGHIMCVPLSEGHSFASFMDSQSISSSQVEELLGAIGTYLMNKAVSRGFECNQVIFFEHGSGIWGDQGELYDACGTSVQLSKNALHAHMHAIPIIGNRLDITKVLLTMKDLMREEIENIFFRNLQYGVPFKKGSSSAMYYFLCIYEKGQKLKSISLYPKKVDFLRKIQSQLWRLVLSNVLDKVSEIDLSDYKRLAQLTLGDLPSEETIIELRRIHDLFWHK